MDKIPFDYIEPVITLLLGTGALKATKYVSKNQIVRAVLKTYKFNNHKPSKIGNVEVTLTIGRPNYLEREFIKSRQKSKERFPIEQIQLKFYNPKPNKLSRK